ncbi:ribosome recycling factor [Marinilactibacillus psychrotolerans]|uniref:Ribosome-recycling factor n=2 Tax=Marinilactibacillus psychrotolerans TaxID=191770 RepID=A0A511H310_9LACT|nr:ribosome recycling factor [Marinilactibacillus psychrotolerans]TLQ08258.1 ribosome recycling factor [Marinilactibacillus psychrotolerans]SDC64557.1 ribosome recycling factor [Marinilactibacillus psychrotolerans]SJN38700.1 Ribosome recycling factor [Marinilactibacillus psychrotolerans 42ea]GEL67898.1 ribosome-recycling factor [Marinilactibacillus psychrotolerans]GEQ32709.1 ribosome recycling factor [Marinilactibacillus psychrotolerans]
MSDSILKDTETRMKKAEQAYVRELGSIRAGRANPSLLNRVNVEYYGAETPLNQLAQISVPEARVLLITPYDQNSVGDIEKAINQSDIGIPPSNDGTVIRLVVPALTEERRKEIAKQVGKEAENAKISIRNIRRDSIDSLKKAEKNGDLTKDDLRDYEEEVQKLTNSSVAAIDKLSAEKEKEILDV